MAVTAGNFKIRHDGITRNDMKIKRQIEKGRVPEDYDAKTVTMVVDGETVTQKRNTPSKYIKDLT